MEPIHGSLLVWMKSCNCCVLSDRLSVAQLLSSQTNELKGRITSLALGVTVITPSVCRYGMANDAFVQHRLITACRQSTADCLERV